ERHDTTTEPVLASTEGECDGSVCMAAPFDSTLGRTIEVRWATTSCQAVSRRRVDPSRRTLEAWSLYGAPWSQPAASSGKSPNAVNGKNKPNPLPRAATSC